MCCSAVEVEVYGMRRMSTILMSQMPTSEGARQVQSGCLHAPVGCTAGDCGMYCKHLWDVVSHCQDELSNNRRVVGLKFRSCDTH